MGHGGDAVALLYGGGHGHGAGACPFAHALVEAVGTGAEHEFGPVGGDVDIPWAIFKQAVNIAEELTYASPFERGSTSIENPLGDCDISSGMVIAMTGVGSV